jgi:hypothetical protein
MERIAAILVILVALGLIGLSVFGPRNFGGPPTTFESTADIVIDSGRTFQPDRIQVSSGKVKLTVTNNNSILHQFFIFDPVENRVIATLESIRANGGTEEVWVELVRGRRYQMYDPTWRTQGLDGVIIAN